MVSILGEYNYRFPSKIKLEKKLKDMLEENVDEKYYLSDKMIDYVTGVNQKESKFPRGERFNQSLKMANEKGIATTITTNAGNRATDNFILTENKALNETLANNTIDDGTFIDAYNRSVKKDISGTITTRVNDSNNTFIAIKNATKKGYLLAEDGDGVDISGRMDSHRGTVQKETIQTLTTHGGNDVGAVINPLKGKTSYGWHFEQEVYDENGIARTIKAGGGSGNIPKVIGGIGEKKSNGGTQWYQQDRIYDDNVAISVTTSFNPYYKNGLRIRKLTGKECYRLMGFSDEDCDNARKVLSENMIYHVSGDSICVNVLMAIFGQFFENKRWEEIWKQCIKENISKEEI